MVNKFLSWVAYRAGITLCRHRQNPVVRAIHRVALRLHTGLENLNYDCRTNGELEVLRKLAACEPRCVFDVGANHGEWAKLAHETFRDATIHCFEIAQPTFEKLSEELRQIDRIHINNVGLSDKPGEVTLQYDPDQDGATSGVEIVCPSKSHLLIGTVSTGDEYVRANGIKSIDFLKIDVEGMEDKVLRGFHASLENKIVKVIQFEYGLVSIASRFLLRDFYTYLEPLDFLIGKIYPTYVDFRPYDFRNEDFIGPNFLAVLKHQTALVAALHSR
jgi:FkbM family methyltransferase